MKIVSRNRILAGTTFLILSTGALYGCKDFLVENSTPQGTLDEQTLANRTGVEGTLIGAYRTLDCTTSTSSNWGCAASDWVWGSVVADDSYKGSDGTDQPPINDLEGYHWGTPDAESYLDNKWRIVYEGVVRSNSTLRLLHSVAASKPGEFSASEVQQIEGEALFLRAYYHFEAYRMWGNIPTYTEDETDFRKPNGTADQAVAFILKDLDAAIAALPTTPRNSNVGRATKWTAKAYKGRVQLYAGQYAAALATLNDVKNNGPYALESSFDKVWSGFQSNTNGAETIFAYEASANDGEPNGNNANFGERLNFPYSGSHFGCCGFNQPTQNLVNFYKVGADGLPLSVSDPNGWNASNANLSASVLTPVDPRLDWTVGRDNVPYKDWGLYSLADGWVRDVANGGPYGPKKNAHEQASGAESSVGWQNTQLNSVNIHLYRYADLLLNLAEAMVETGDLNGARLIVNQIRARAAATANGCGFPVDPTAGPKLVAKFPQCAGDKRIAVPIDDPSITWAVYKVSPYPSFPDVAYARTAVRNERRLELAMEGQRFFDLRRWGIADVTLNAYINGVGGGAEKSAARRLYKAGAEPLTARHRWYPIPAIQIELSRVGGEDRLTQNPGW
jgi:starch-binding outer membrane protein, SusD/RagB family